MLRGALLALLLLPGVCSAQMDPERRRLVQLGYDKPLSGAGPIAAYLFFYANEPKWVRPDQTLRIALAPTYLDLELGRRGLLPRTDAGLGLAGGGYAEGYNEIRRGHYFKEESFDGHSVSASGSLYPKLSPDSWRIPLNMVVRASAHRKFYKRRAETDGAFELPPDHSDFRFRAGLRLGGSPPEMRPKQALELSFWYQGYLRDRQGLYGLGDDRPLHRTSHFYWTRLLASLPIGDKRHLKASVEGGGSATPDRLNAYRLGSLLPFASEFPLSLPGYFNGEISAKSYFLASADYLVPIDWARGWAAHVFGSGGKVGYLRGMDQPNAWNNGVGAGVDYQSPKGFFRFEVNYAYGVHAMRSGGRGAHTVGVVSQLDLRSLGRSERPERAPTRGPTKPEGIDWFFRMFEAFPR